MNNSWQPLAFFSRQLRPAEQRYSTFDRELLAIRHFRFFLEGRPFTAFTDHKPLVYAMSKLSEPWTARQQRHLAFISEFSTDIQHISGKSNVVADCLSRPTLDQVILGIDYAAMAKAQTNDADVQALRTSTTGLDITLVPFEDSGQKLLCDVSTNRARPIVPFEFRRRIFEIIHNLSHPGRKATVKLVAEKFVWPGLKKQINKWAKECVACQTSKIQTHVRSPIEKITVPKQRFSHIHVDLVGPLPPSQGYTHLFTIIDRSTRWPEAIPVNSTTAAECARALIRNWIARFGVPLDMSSDRGSQFTSTLWNEVARHLGIQLHRTTSYHPQANGIIERFHRSLKASLKARLQGPDWIDQLPWVLLGLRTVPKDDINTTSAELVYGETLTVPGEFISPSASTTTTLATNPFQLLVKQLSPPPTSHHGCTPSTVPLSLNQAKFVFVRRDCHRGPLHRPYDGPYQVISRGEKTFRLRIGGHEDVVTVDRLKAAYVDLSQPVETAQPRPRGRPRIATENHLVPEGQISPFQQATRSGRVTRPPDRLGSS